jgi:hypothetical protein
MGVHMVLLRLRNLMFLLSLVGCLAGTMAGLIVFAPLVGGAWFLTLLATVGSEPSPPAPRTRLRPHRARDSSRHTNPAVRPVPAPAGGRADP